MSIRFHNKPSDSNKVLDEIRKVIGEPSAHDGQHFLFDDLPILSFGRKGLDGKILTKGKLLEVFRAGGYPVDIKPHEDSEIVSLSHGKFIRVLGKWVRV